jgi:SAM-dependent methyltransferase
MEFKKYQKRGAYHWTEYEQKTIYGLHARKVKEWVRKGSTLDIGAGDGLITHLLQAQGIDNNALAVNLARGKGADVSMGSAYDLKTFLDGKFDNVLLADVLEHLETPEKALKEVKRVLKKDGYLYIVTPPAKEDGTLHDPSFHYKEYKPEELTEFIVSQGFEEVEPVEVVNDRVRMYGIYRKI